MSTPLKVVGWSPSRLGKYNECPAKVKYEDILKLCPLCKKGKISGGFDGDPVVCDTCNDEQPSREALERGTRLDMALSEAVQGIDPEDVGPLRVPKAPSDVQASVSGQVAEELAEATRHPEVAALVKKLQKAKGVTQQESIVLDSKWNRVSQYTKGAWGRLKLDVLWLTSKVAHVIDWKSGGVLRTGEVRAQDKYNGQMEMYQAAVLSCYPQASVTAKLVFVDAGPKFSPFVERPELKRKDLDAAKKNIERKLLPLMNDTIFAPRPGFYCTYCAFRNSNGGPCSQG